MALPPQQFCVRWNSYHTNLQSWFPRLLLSEQFADVTLACESRQLRCHKLVLSACSGYLERLLAQNPCTHPIVLMRDMRFSEMQALVDFMYKGEVNVTQEELPSLLKSAEALQIRGLCSSEAAGEARDYALASDALLARTDHANGPLPAPVKSSPPPAPPTAAPKKEESADVKEETVEEDGLYYGELDHDHMDYHEEEEGGKAGGSLGQSSAARYLRVRPENELFFQTKLRGLVRARGRRNQEFEDNHGTGTKQIAEDKHKLEDEAPSHGEGNNGHKQGFEEDKPNLVLEKTGPEDSKRASEEKQVGDDQPDPEEKLDKQRSENDYYKSWLEQNGELEVSLLRASQAKRPRPAPHPRAVELLPRGAPPRERRRGRPPLQTAVGEGVLKADLEQFLEGAEVSSSGLARADLERVMMGKFNPNRRYSNEAMWAALMDVKKGGSIYRAAQTHKVPRKSLRNWMKRCHIKSSFPMPQQLKQFVENSRRQRGGGTPLDPAPPESDELAFGRHFLFHEPASSDEGAAAPPLPAPH